MTEFSPLESFENALHHWRLVVILTIVGGLVGLIFHRLQPPVYDATVVFSIGIDFKNVGRELTQYEEDLAVGAAGGLILSTQVMEKVATQARSQDIQIDYEELRRISTLERRQTLWELRVRNTNPKTAETVANIWGQQALADLREARQHAWQAYRIQDELQVLSQCIQDPNFVLPSGITCDSTYADDVEQSIDVKQAEFDAELQAARGILPALLFDLSSEAHQADKPVALGVNLLVLSGASIGFLIGVISSDNKVRK